MFNKDIMMRKIGKFAFFIGALLIIVNHVFCYRKLIIGADIIVGLYLIFGFVFLPLHRWMISRDNVYEHMIVSLVVCVLFYGGVLVFILGVFNKQLASENTFNIVVPLSGKSGTHYTTDAVGCSYHFVEFEIEDTTRDIKIDCDESFPSGDRVKITYLEGWLGVKVILKKEIVE